MDAMVKLKYDSNSTNAATWKIFELLWFKNFPGFL